MTSTGIFMRFAVRENASLHCAAFMRRNKPERSAAKNTPVPAADNQLIVNTAASGFAPGFATGGMRCTFLSRSGIVHFGSERVQEKSEPRRVVLNLTLESELSSAFLYAGDPHNAQQRIRIVHGIHASIV